MNRKIITAVLIILISLPLLSNDGRQIMEDNKPAIVSIWTIEKIYTKYNSDYSYRFLFDTLMLSGTGFFIDPSGIIATNLHVIDYLDSIIVKTSDSLYYNAEFIKSDIDNDIALIRLMNTNGKLFNTVILGNSDNVQAGEECYAIGNPFGFEYTISKGIVSGIRLDQTIDYYESETKHFEKVLQFDAAISPGNSGGPLFNSQNEVIGITTYTQGSYGNLLFGVCVNSLAKLVENEINDSLAAVFDKRTRDYRFMKIQWYIESLITEISNNDRYINNEYSWNIPTDSARNKIDSLNKIYKTSVNLLMKINLSIRPDTLITYENLLDYCIMTDNIDEIKQLVQNNELDTVISEELKVMTLNMLKEKGSEIKDRVFKEKSKSARYYEANFTDADIAELNKSIAYFNLYLEIDNSSTDVICNLLDIYVRLNDTVNVQKTIKVVQSNPDLAGISWKDMLFDVLYEYVADNEYYLAARTIKKYLKPFFENEIELKFMLAFCYQETGKVEHAIKIYNNLIEKNEGFVYAYVQLGMIYSESNDLNAAKYNLLKALKLGSESHSKFYYSWYNCNSGSIYNVLLKVALKQKNKSDVMLYYSVMNMSKYSIEGIDEYEIIKLIKGI